MVKAHKAKVLAKGKKFEFGVRVPFGIKQAMMLDKENRNTVWLDAIKHELKCLGDWKVFRILEKGEQGTQEFK